MLVRSDNTTVVAFINRQGGVQSRSLHSLAKIILLWSRKNLLSLRAIHVPAQINISRQICYPQLGEWRLHSEVVQEIWYKYGHTKAYLFASEENTLEF